MKITNEERAVLSTLTAYYEKQGRNPLISFNSLRLESALLGAQNNIQFAMNSTDNSIVQSATETRLNLGDKFTATRIGMYIMKVATAAAAADRAIGRLRTYPNPQIFVGAAEANNLMSIYNSELRIESDSIVYFPSLRTENFYRVPWMQELLAQQLTAGIDAGSTATMQRDPWPDDEWGKIMLIPSVTFSGGKTNVLQINLPSSLTLAGTSSSNICVLYFDGFLQQNVNSNNINQ